MTSKRITLIGISGKKGSGKSTFADYLKQGLGADYELKSFAAPLKAVVAAFTGCPAYQLEDQAFKASPSPIRDVLGLPFTYRELLQKVGTDFGRNQLSENVWIDALFSRFAPEDDCWIITDVRFPNEADAIRERGGVVIRLDRPGHVTPDIHPSETALDDYPFDYRIANTGTLSDLWAEAWALAKPNGILSQAAQTPEK